VWCGVQCGACGAVMVQFRVVRGVVQCGAMWCGGVLQCGAPAVFVLMLHLFSQSKCAERVLGKRLKHNVLMVFKLLPRSLLSLLLLFFSNLVIIFTKIIVISSITMIIVISSITSIVIATIIMLL
jgi:hypothetical protein